MRKVLIGLLFLLLFYARFVGLDWGLPYPMHPDERNMVVAIQSLKCDILQECFNPHFFAYGQFPLYLGYGVVQLAHLLSGRFGQEITFVEAALALRFISAAASILNAFILIKILQFFFDKKLYASSVMLQVSSLAVIIFSPYFIQFSHFGTTESLLMLFYSTTIYICLQMLVRNVTNTKLTLLAVITGLAVATKISSIIFAVLPVLAFLYLCFKSKNYKKILLLTTSYLLLTGIVAILFSPHNFLNWQDFLGSMRYETAVGTGIYKAFYTRQFEHTTPILFQLTKIFPYALGLPQYVFFILGFILLPWKDSKYNLLRLAFLIYFIPTSFLYAKWTRFIAPVFPIATISVILFLFRIKSLLCHSGRSVATDRISSKEILSLRSRMTHYCLLFVVLISILPGIAYLSIYQNSDIRFQASEWIYKNVPENSKILSETANVIDIPIEIPGHKPKTIPNYQYISFNFYDIDNDQLLQQQLEQNIKSADYIFVPSRRLFKNNIRDYPLLYIYYQKLFSGKLGFTKIAEFSSFPQIRFQVSNIKFHIPLPDEDAEETWTVFDHPVIRIYKRNDL